MFETTSHPDYAAIFDRRGEAYHRAMLAAPAARAAEFRQVVSRAGLHPGDRVADAPAGGGYLRAFLPADVRLVSIETSRTFWQQHQTLPGDETLWAEDLAHLPLAGHSLDAFLSLAGAHHLPVQRGFYREVCRVLKPGGRLVLADVQEGSAVARFLNEWVHAHNSLGHRGRFLTPGTAAEVAAAGFAEVRAEPERYTWNFSSEAAMLGYCRELFGIDRATEGELLDALEHILGVERDGAARRLRWELLFIAAEKPCAT